MERAVTDPRVRAFEVRDIPAILRIQRSSPSAAQWPESAYRHLGSAHENAWVAEHDGALSGFLVARLIAPEMEILNLAVDASLRRKGIGTALLRHALLSGSQDGFCKVFLEVRSSNKEARSFYEVHGFVPAGVRPGYYRDPGEDALILALALGAVNLSTSSQPLST